MVIAFTSHSHRILFVAITAPQIESLRGAAAAAVAVAEPSKCD